MTGYERVKKWREKKKKNAKYANDYMREKRREYRAKYLAGKIAYKDIPVGYRCFKALR